MSEWYIITGKLLCGLGGGLMCLLLLGLLLYFVCCAWIAFSNKFRSICQAESIIFEYRKNRHEFMVWKHTKGGEQDG